MDLAIMSIVYYYGYDRYMDLAIMSILFTIESLFTLDAYLYYCYFMLKFTIHHTSVVPLHYLLYFISTVLLLSYPHTEHSAQPHICLSVAGNQGHQR